MLNYQQHKIHSILMNKHTILHYLTKFACTQDEEYEEEENQKEEGVIEDSGSDQ